MLQQQLPDARPAPLKETPVPTEIRNQFEMLTAQDPFDLEKECLGHNHSPSNDIRVRHALEKVTAETDATRALSLARAGYRWGFLDQVQRVCALFPGPEADLFRACWLWKSGQKSDFGQAGPEADYLRALSCYCCWRQGAGCFLSTHICLFAPKAYRPRLTKAYLNQNLSSWPNHSLENLGSPEAQLVLSMLGDKAAAVELQKLLRGNIDAASHIYCLPTGTGTRGCTRWSVAFSP